MGHFLPFYPPNSPEDKNFKNMKKKPGDIIILHMCTKNYCQMMYSSWNMVHGRCNCYLLFSAIFCPFTLLLVQKIKILKKWKKCHEISWFYIFIPKSMIRWCTVPEICCTTDGQTDRWMEKVVYRGVRKKNTCIIISAFSKNLP